MSSQGAFTFASSPSSVLDGGATRRRKSRFTFRQLSHLAASSPTCPLRVVAHIDLDAFYAQCEMVRLGVPEDQPLAVQVWSASSGMFRPRGWEAISRPARVLRTMLT